MNKSNNHNFHSDEKDLLTNSSLLRSPNRQRNRIDYSTLSRIDSLALSLESDKTVNTDSQTLEKAYQEYFKETISLKGFMQRLWNRVVKKSIIRITRVDFVFKANSFDNLQDFWGMWIDSPLKGIQANSSSILIAGWILGKSYNVSTIRILLDGEMVGESPVNLFRPDVAEKYFFVPDARNSGFCIVLDIDKLPQTGHLIIQAIFSNHSSLFIGAIQYCGY